MSNIGVNNIGLECQNMSKIGCQLFFDTASDYV